MCDTTSNMEDEVAEERLKHGKVISHTSMMVASE